MPPKKYRPAPGVQLSVWSVNGAPIPPDVVKQLEETVEQKILELFNDGYRLLTSTSRG